MKNFGTITMPAPETAPAEPTTKPADPDTEKSPATKPGKDNDPWNVPAPNYDPAPKA